MSDTLIKAGARMALSVAEAAQIVGLGRSNLYLAIQENKLRTLKVGGRRLVRPEDLSAWLESHAA